MQRSLANQNKWVCQASLQNSTSYGSRTRDLRLERAASLATRRTRRTRHWSDCTLLLVLCQGKIRIVGLMPKSLTWRPQGIATTIHDGINGHGSIVASCLGDRYSAIVSGGHSPCEHFSSRGDF